MGMLLPSEPTKGRIANLLHKCGMTQEAQSRCQGPRYKIFLDQVKDELAPLPRVKATMPHITLYPLDPEHLRTIAPDIYKKLYTVDPPAQRDVPELQSTGVRSTHKDFSRAGSGVMVCPSVSGATDTATAMQNMFGASPMHMGSGSQMLYLDKNGNLPNFNDKFGANAAPPMMEHMMPMMIGMMTQYLQMGGMAGPQQTAMMSQMQAMMQHQHQPGASADRQASPDANGASQFSPEGVSKALSETSPFPKKSEPTGRADGHAVRIGSVAPGAPVPYESDHVLDEAPPPTATLDESLDEDEANMVGALKQRAERLAVRAALKRPAAADGSTVGKKRARGAATLGKAAEKLATDVPKKKKIAADLPLEATSKAKPKKMPPPLMGPQGTDAAYYRAAKIKVSTSKGGYRVFCDCSVANPTDKTFKWIPKDTKAARAKTWADVLKHIDSERK
jgi:hypothetical protein